MNRYCASLLALSLLAGCATGPPPPLTVDDPANPSAPEVPARPLRNALGADGLTRKSRQILAQAAKEQQQWDQSGPASGEQEEPMKDMSGMKMPQKQPSPSPTPQQQQLPGMQMPQEPSRPSPPSDN
jgi:hypothetical protein